MNAQSRAPTSYWRYPETHEGDVIAAYDEGGAIALAAVGCDEITEEEYLAALGGTVL